MFAACSGQSSPGSGSTGFALPEHARLTPRPGQRVVGASLTAKPTDVDIGGRTVSTWAYGDTIPGPAVRARAGDLLRVTLKNSLEADTSGG